MESKLWGLLPVESLPYWILFVVLVGFFLYKEAPGFWERVKRRVQGEVRTDTLTARLDRIEADVQEIKEKLIRDYDRINAVETRQDHDQRIMKDIKQEQGIIMRALLGALSGLQELGANGGTEQAKAEIIDYLNHQAHEGD